MTETMQKVEEYKSYIVDKEKALEQLNELIPAIEQWPRKLIDKNFFEQDKFKVTNDSNYTYHKYGMYKPTYSFDRYNHRLPLGRNYNIELQTRETAEVLTACKDLKARLEKEIKDNKQAIKDIQGLNEKQLIKDLQALYFKYNKPVVWGRILDLYDVKYPEK